MVRQAGDIMGKTSWIAHINNKSARQNLKVILEDHLVRVLEQNQELVNINTDLQKQVHHLKHVTVSNEIRERMGGSLGPTDSLDSILKQMRDASEKRKELEQLRSETLKQLREKQLAVKNETNFAQKAKMLEAIEALQSKIRELEKKTELQNVRHEELMIEMAAMKKTQGIKLVANSATGQIQWKPACRPLSHQEVQTSPDSNPSSPDLDSQRVDCMRTFDKLGPFTFEGFYSAVQPMHPIGYRGNAYSQRVPSVPSHPSRIHSIPSNPTQSQGVYSHRPNLTRHRSLTNFIEHENSYHSPYLELMAPEQNYPLWNDNYPPSRFSTKVPSYQQHNSFHWSDVPQQHRNPARSLSQQNLNANISSLSSAYESQLKNLCMGIDNNFNNYWAFRNSHFNADNSLDLQRLSLKNFDSYNLAGTDKDFNYNSDALWPTANFSSYEVTSNPDYPRPYRNNLKNTINNISGNLKNLEKWPKSLETLPKTPTDIRSKSVMSVDSNLLSNYPVFPCDPMGPTAELSKPSAASGAASGHVYGHKATDRVDRSHFGTSQRPLPADSAEIDRIMAKIEQDNRVLAELDKTRATVGGIEGILSGGRSRLLPKAGNRAVHWNLSGTRQKDQNLSKRCLPTPGGELSRQAGLSSLGPTVPGVSNIAGTYLPGSTLPVGLSGNLSTLGNSYMMPGGTQSNILPLMNYCTSVKRIMPQIPTSAFDIEGTLAGLTPAEQAQLQQLVQQQPSSDNSGLPIPDMLDIPGKGRCYVYIARYSYDPFQQSLNENPEAELSINAGDYLLVWGNVDEDGFCDGELLDGRRGLVPSNFIQKLVGDDLLEFHQSVVLNLRDVDDCNSTTIPQDLDMAAQNQDYLGEGVYRRTDGAPFIEMEAEMLLEEDDTMNEANPEGQVPAPKQLTLERQLNKSILIGWNHPDTPSPAPIDSYHVYVDGVLKTTVKATERTRALVEGVDSNRPHRISVRSVTQNRRTSRDAACTMVIGKDIPLGPTCVKASNITSTSAVISWLPSNSNSQHVVCVNNVQVRTVKPGVYRHTITGLAPNTIYRVTVRAKNIRAPHFDEKSQKQLERLSCHMEFRTLSKGKGLPEAPCDIQVEPGPQDGTLLVTWIPVTTGLSINVPSPVTGYAVYADGKKVTDVDSPTGDHALIDINKLIGLNPKQVTVRTKSRDAQSSDSPPAAIPQHILRGKSHSKETEKQRYTSSVPPHMRQGHQRTRIDQHGQVVIEPEENLSDKEIYPHMKIPAIEITKDSASEANFSEDDFVDGRRNPRGHHGGPSEARGQPMRGHDPRRMERGRGGPGGPPPHPPPQERDMYYGDGQRGRGGPGPYRGGPPPGRGGIMPQQRQQQMGPPDRRIRYFVALFDYDPTTMSPNPDACEEELPFNEGDSIKVYGEKDADGFYWGECRGRKGFVPHNMVVEVQDPKAAEGVRGSRDRWGDIYANMPMRKMIALYDYDPQELSPNVDAEVELSFQTGDIIYVYGDMDDDGFYMGELDGVRGLVPSNFLTDAPDDYGEGGSSALRGGHRGGRGHGPGARGPPPPPRNDPSHARRKDACPPPHDSRTYRDGMGPGRAPGPGGLDPRADPRRGGRGRGGPQRGPQHPNIDNQMQNQQNQYLDSQTYSQQQQQQQQSHQQQYQQQQQQHMQQQQQQQQPQQQKPLKGIPAVVPDFVIPNNKESPTQPPPTSNFLPQAPNIMGKLSELTSSGSGAVEAGADLLSKGKELIFMKFGLGGK